MARILIAEDESAIASFLERGLGAAGHSTMVVADGRQAAAIARDDAFDLMLLDLAGHVRHTIHRPYAFPSPADLTAFLTAGVEELMQGIDWVHGLPVDTELETDAEETEKKLDFEDARRILCEICGITDEGLTSKMDDELENVKNSD